MIMRTANSDQHWIEVIDAQGRLIRTTAFRGGVVNDLRWEGCD
jgi:hypothetical protein